MKIKVDNIFSKRNWFIFGVSFIVATILFLIFFYTKQADLYNAMNSSFYVGIIFTFGAGLVFVTECGMFDVFAVGFANLFAVAKRNGHKKYDTLYDYKEQKRIARSSNVYITCPILFTGLLFFIASIVIMLIWKNGI